jgi:hypothetical protein
MSVAMGSDGIAVAVEGARQLETYLHYSDLSNIRVGKQGDGPTGKHAGSFSSCLSMVLCLNNRRIK